MPTAASFSPEVTSILRLQGDGRFHNRWLQRAIVGALQGQLHHDDIAIGIDAI
jgi:hypothetical protein